MTDSDEYCERCEVRMEGNGVYCHLCIGKDLAAYEQAIADVKRLKAYIKILEEENEKMKTAAANGRCWCGVVELCDEETMNSAFAKAMSELS